MYNLKAFISKKKTIKENKMWELFLPVRLKIRNSQHWKNPTMIWDTQK